MDEASEKPLVNTSAAETQEEVDARRGVEVFRILTTLHQSFLHSGYNSVFSPEKGPGELWLEKEQVGKVIIRAARPVQDADVELITTSYSGFDESVEGDVRIIIRAYNNLQILEGPTETPLGKLWKIKSTVKF